VPLLVLGLDPGLGTTGWGIVRSEGTRLSHLANGQLRTTPAEPLAARLSHLQSMLDAVLADHGPAAAAVEEVFVNDNPRSTLKLAQARGVVLAACARAGLAVGEYAPRLVKKALVGVGNADKAQVQAMVARLLPGTKLAGADAADALAVAITHAHHLSHARGVSRSAAA
jgi:crossover junction endodeoxyribonuclease RuvC